MDIFEAIFTRRSIRRFTDEPVSDEDLRIILKSAMLAPSACNQQPWHFIILRDADSREKASRTSPYTAMAAHAPLVIIVCGDTKDEKAKGFWIEDCSASTENLLLAARGKNIGTVWCGVYPVMERVDYLRNALGIPEHVIPLGLICAGHPAQEFREAERFREDRIHLEKW